MRFLVTGSAGHLGEALVRTLRERGDEVLGIDLLASPFTTHVGSIASPDFLGESMRGVDRIIHAATLHKPHVATHPRSAFVATNVAGTLHVLETALRSGVGGVVLSSTTSAFGAALVPAPGEPARWMTEGGRRRDPQERVRRHQDRCGGPLRALLPVGGSALHRAPE
jgi:nucleoside-diphosphate-sugar epimerase